MGFPIRKIKTVATTGNLDTIVATTRTPGATVNMGQVKPGSLVAEISCDIETSTITLYADWQVSDDASTWIVLAPANNAANVVLGTGTGGADATVAKALEAIRGKYEQGNTTVHIIGFAKAMGDIAQGAAGVLIFFGVAWFMGRRITR